MAVVFLQQKKPFYSCDEITAFLSLKRIFVTAHVKSMSNLSITLRFIDPN